MTGFSFWISFFSRWSRHFWSCDCVVFWASALATNSLAGPDVAAKSGREAEGNVVEMPNRNRDAGFDPLADLDPDDPLLLALRTFAPPTIRSTRRVRRRRAGRIRNDRPAFAAGDRENLQMLLSDDVYENFEAAIDERDEAEETLNRQSSASSRPT